MLVYFLNTRDTFPPNEARCKAVFPLFVAALTCAPRDNNPATTDV